MEPKTGKRIVSKGEYAKVQSKRAGVTLGGAFLLLLCIACALLAFVSGICVIPLAVWLAAQAAGQAPRNLFDVVWICLCAIMTAAFGMGTYSTARLYKNAVEMLDSINNVVPLTRANTTDLPAPDSLVRASSEPLQAQEGVLLRAASTGQETPSEQLVRASVGQEQP